MNVIELARTGRRLPALGLAGVLLIATPAALAQEARLPSEREAPIAHLVDISSGQVLFSRHADRRFVPASVTKVMTLMLAFDMMEEGTLAPGRVITVSEDIAEAWSGVGSSMRLEAGDMVSVHDLLIAIATGSANDASVVLAQAAAGSVEDWTRAMTARARELGLTQSHFGTPNGWPDEGRTFVTARDLVTLAEAIIERHPERFRTYIGRKEVSYRGFTRVNQDPLIGRVRGGDGIKTGFTNEAGFGFLGTAKRGDQRLVVVIGGSYSGRERNAAARGLVEWGFSQFERRALYAKAASVSEARVQNGNMRAVGLVTDRPVIVNVPQGAGGELSLTVRYDGPLRAPIAAGEQIATLVITAPGMAPARVPLVAREEVKEANLFERIANGVVGWFT
ncbi:MAG: D-alanyl-D-alanine carboxypeptidase family protein [Erythrobacter sp.]|jgi:D-alanyl-D-alanine carboxypeptidase (penicillin-binding protein 5/6)|nr:D-alanyl-D-alanine carboxypeptidase family protein [Erythrobacter sp.]